jgi:hypothetical protein
MSRCADCPQPVRQGHNRCATCTAYMLASLPTPLDAAARLDLARAVIANRIARDAAYRAKRAARDQGDW